MRKLVRKSYTPVVPIANTCSIGYPHDGRADNAAYRHDRRADNTGYRHDRRADGNKTTHRQDNSPTWFLRQFTDTSEDNSSTLLFKVNDL